LRREFRQDGELSSLVPLSKCGWRVLFPRF
jgi:hypothetical protein